MTASTLDLTAATRRTTRLARANWTLLVRNRMTLAYAVAMPLLPLGLLVLGPSTAQAGTAVVGTTLLMALVFPGYYNLLSMFVSRRDELVLKRLRTGELRDLELVTSMALPGVVITLGVAVLAVPLAVATGLDAPTNPVLLLVGLLLAVLTFAAFALWTAAWTRTAESAQLTSTPVIVLATAGLFTDVVPPSLQTWFHLMPGAAVQDLVRIGWFARGDAGAALSFAQTWTEAAPAVGTLVGWTVLAVLLAARSLRWEPRT